MCLPFIAHSYIDFLEAIGIPVDPSVKAARLPSANVWPGQTQDEYGDPIEDMAVSSRESRVGGLGYSEEMLVK